jgi:hypothetical protein
MSCIRLPCTAGTSPVLQGIMEEVAKRYSGESNVPYDVMEEV